MVDDAERGKKENKKESKHQNEAELRRSNRTRIKSIRADFEYQKSTKQNRKSEANPEKQKKKGGRPRKIPQIDQSAEKNLHVEVDDSKEEPEVQETSSESEEELSEQEKKNREVQNLFDDAILSLQEYSLPDHIPCRESEQEVIRNFIQAFFYFYFRNI